MLLCNIVPRYSFYEGSLELKGLLSLCVNVLVEILILVKERATYFAISFVFVWLALSESECRNYFKQ